MKKHLTEEELELGTIQVAEKAPENVKNANKFGEDYTMEVISDNEPGADMFRIPFKDPKFEYRFLRDDKANMGIKTSNLLLLKGGWQIVPLRHLTEVNKIDKKLLHPDGSFHVGELILAFMPKELFKKKMAEDRIRSDEAMARVQRELDGETRIDQIGVRGISKGKIKEGPLAYGSHNEVDDEKEANKL